MANFPIGADVQPAINNIDKLIAALTKAGKQAGLTEDEIAKLVNTAKQAGNEGAGGISKINTELGNLGGIAKTATTALAGVFALDKLKEFVGQVVNITGEFQKFEAVLTNTLGSNSVARRALADIQKFAAATPFSVRELTESFVKLANQGFRPTQDELRKLGDLAASTGKSFDQLTEAIIDAQTGEFERLKEFGIRASKAGDQVTFSFKGVQTQTNFTADSIRKYLLTLGDLEGVTGSMKAISETLTGKINNLGDSWDQLLKTIGDGNKGVFKDAVSLLDQALQKATELLKTSSQETQENIDRKAGAVFDIYKGKDANEQLEYKQKIYERILYLSIEIAKVEKIQRENQGKFGSDQKSYSISQFIQNKEDLAALNTAIDLIRNAKEEEAKLNSQKQKGTQLTRDQIDAEKTRLDHIKKIVDEVNADIAKGTKEGDIDIGNANAVGGKIDAFWETRDLLDAYGKKLDAQMKEQDDKEFQRKEEKRKSEEDSEKLHLQRINQLRQSAFDFAQQLGNALFAFNQQNIEADLQSLQEQHDYEVNLAGNNAKAKEKADKDYNNKRKQLQREQAEAQRNQSIFNIIANTAESVIKIGAQMGVLAPPFQALAALTGALQLAVVLNAKLPRFAKGVYDLQGPGTTTSDSIFAMLSAHESVVPAEQSKKFRPILKPMIEDPSFSIADVRNIIDQNVPSYVRGDLFNRVPTNTETQVLTEVRDLLKEIKNKPVRGTSIDARGVYEYFETETHKKKTYQQQFWS